MEVAAVGGAAAATVRACKAFDKMIIACTFFGKKKMLGKRPPRLVVCLQRHRLVKIRYRESDQNKSNNNVDDNDFLPCVFSCHFLCFCCCSKLICMDMFIFLSPLLFTPFPPSHILYILLPLHPLPPSLLPSPSSSPHRPHHPPPLPHDPFHPTRHKSRRDRRPRRQRKVQPRHTPDQVHLTHR